MVPVSLPLLSTGPHKPPYWTGFRPSRLGSMLQAPGPVSAPPHSGPSHSPALCCTPPPPPSFRFLPLYPVQRGGPTAYSGKCVPEVREPNLEARERTQAHCVPGVRGGGNLEAKYGAS